MNGILNIRKEKGMTSFDAVSKIRRLLRTKKAGHSGTLDPDAEGVLVVCVGRATKLVPDMEHDTKSYEAVMRLGVTTDTQDMTGTILGEWPVTSSTDEVREAVLSFQGEQMQIPPMYSALKVDGQKLCDLARRGVTIERKPRPVTFQSIEVLEIDLPLVRFRTDCSKGAYIRTLCNDIGEKLGCGGTMESLIRTRAGRFEIGDAVTLSELAAAVDSKEGIEGQSFFTGIEEYYGDLPRLTPGKAFDPAIRNGNVIRQKTDLADGAAARVYTSEGVFAGIYRYRTGEGLRLVRYFYEDHT